MTKPDAATLLNDPFFDDLPDLAQKIAEEEAMFGPRIDPTNRERYTPGSMEHAIAVVQFNRRNSAIVAHQRGASLERIKQILTGDSSQVVTERNRFRGRSEPWRAHINGQLAKAYRRAVKENDMRLVHAPWLHNPDLLYEYAGMPPEGSAYEWKFLTINPQGAFEPGNVQWMSHESQLARLRIRTVEFEGETVTLAEVAKRTGLTVTKIRARWDAGVRGPDLWAGRNLGARLDVDIDGVKMTIADIAAATGIKATTIRARLKRGLSGKELFSKADKRTGSGNKPVRDLGEKREVGNEDE